MAWRPAALGNVYVFDRQLLCAEQVGNMNTGSVPANTGMHNLPERLLAETDSRVVARR